MRLRALIVLVVLLAGFVGIAHRINGTNTKLQREEVKQKAPGTREGWPKATMKPGRVVCLKTSKGEIDFVLFEKDCPFTTARIAQLVEAGDYNKIAFSRVEKDQLIQVAQPKRNCSGLEREICEGLFNTKGAVAMAQLANAPLSGSSVFYILMEPWRHLDYDYTVFGRLTRGMDVAMKIKRGDVIEKATLRPFTSADKKRLGEVLRIESERNTQ